MSENERAVKSFLLSKNGTSPATQEHYRLRLKIFLEHLDKKNIALSDFTQENLIAFFGGEYKRLKPKTMNHLKGVVIAFIKFTYPTDWFSKFPNLAAICKCQRVIPKYDSSQMLTAEEVQTLIQKENNPFWKAVFAIQFYGGSRPGEICKLKWSDITFADDGIYFKIYSAKNNKYFEKFVPDEYSFYLKEMQKKSKSDYVFVNSNDNTPITRNAVYMHLIRLGEKVFPDKKINPYLLRHSIATILYARAEKGELNEDVVARQMGHSKSMKGVYCQFNQKHLRANARKIYIKAEITPEKKEEFEKKIESQGKTIKKLIALSELMSLKALNKITPQEFSKKLQSVYNQFSDANPKKTD
jgi:integrase